MSAFDPVSATVGGLLIGAAASLLMLGSGRIAGVSGILGGALAGPAQDRPWRLTFLVGLPVGAIVMLPPLLLRQAFGQRHYGRVYALSNVGLALGIGFGPGAVGWLKDLAGGYGPTLWMLAAIHLAAALAILSGGRRS